MSDDDELDDLAPGYYLASFALENSRPFVLDGIMYYRVDEPEDIDEQIEMYKSLMLDLHGVDGHIHYVNCDDNLSTFRHEWTDRQVVGNKSVVLTSISKRD